MNNMKIIDKVLKRCRTDENYELDDVIEELEKFKLAQEQVKNLSLGNVSVSVLNEVENLMQRWHLSRDNDHETIDNINKLLVKNGRLQWENGKCKPTER